MSTTRSLFALFVILTIGWSAISRAEGSGSGTGSGSGSGSGSSPTGGLGDGMRAYADLLRAQGEFIVDISIAQLNWAKANLVNAQAAFEWQRARELQLLVDRLELELKRLRQDEYKMRALIQQISDTATTFNVINTGTTSQFVFQAFNFLLIRAVPTGVVKDSMTVSVPSFSADNFVPNNKGVTPIPFPGGNVGMLMHFLQKNNYSLEPFREAHVAILGAIQQMVDAANQRISDIQDQMEALRNGTLDIWKIPPADPVPGAPVQEPIIPPENPPTTPPPTGR